MHTKSKKEMILPDELKARVRNTIQNSDFPFELDPDEVTDWLTTANVDIDETNIVDYIKISQYIMARHFKHLSRAKAYELVYPERCYITEKSYGNRFADEEKQIGEKLAKATIEYKASKMETTQRYKKMYAILTMSPFMMYAVDRMKVIDYTLKKIFDEDVKDMAKVQYIKTFLEETKQPEEVTPDTQVNVNINGDVNVVSQINNSLKAISDKLKGKGSQEIIDAIMLPKDSNE